MRVHLVELTAKEQVLTGSDALQLDEPVASGVEGSLLTVLLLPEAR